MKAAVKPGQRQKKVEQSQSIARAKPEKSQSKAGAKPE